MDHDFQFSAGHKLDDFEIEASLYAGALAEVYRAVDTLTREIVAIKVPSSDVINHPLVFYHYQNEMRILSGLNHPNVVRTVLRDRTTAYAIFEYIPGIDLRHHLQSRKRLSLERALDYTVQIAQGLSYLHDCGIIHLDIKPENILITPLERVKIIDFGLARQLGAPDLLFEDFVRPHGTPDYVSPEQLAHHRDDPRADQYSLALVLYEMLTGRLPFEKSQKISRARRRMKMTPPSPRRFREEIPAAMEAIILRALSADPQARYPSVAAFSGDLQAVELPAEALDRRPVTAASISPPDRGSHPSANQCPIPAFNAIQPGILAAVADDDHAESVADAALQAAMADSLPVTLLTVVNSDAADEWIRYGDEARGKRLSRRLEQLSLKFRHFGIDPSVRIRSGTPAEVIVETATAIGVGLIVMGKSRKRFFKHLFGGGIFDRVLKNSPCRVVVAGRVQPPRFPVHRSPNGLTHEEIQQAETFLTTLWIEQIHWMAAFVQGLLTEPHMPQELPEDQSSMQSWIQDMLTNSEWAPLARHAQSTYDQLQDAVANMKAAARHQERNQLCRIYLQDALPLLCRLRDSLQAVSTVLRSLSGQEEIVRTGLLRRPTCPIDERPPFGSGPIRQLQTLKEYFCSQADAPRDQCRIIIDDGQGQPA